MLNVTARQDLMSKIIETLGVVVEDARFDFGENGLEIRVVDPSHVAMIQMNIDSAAFDTWELDETKLGLELRKIKELVSLGGPTDMIEMAYGDETGVLTVNLGKIDRNIRPLDNTTMNPPTLPELKLPCKVTISGSDFTQALKAARQVGDLVNFSIDENTFTVHVQGSTDSVTVAFNKDELQHMECEKPARSQYSLTYLVPLSKIFGNLESVNIGFGENYPLSMSFNFHDGAAEVQYFLAPRVENDY
ncbi:MAG: DNA polymerase sliding clamp [Candidatus Poseidoniaceae archaeon]|jgi:proliferating cell nuclear antigen|tara:strand:- start:1421 stop:2161 length:741 start_codon:yes stop_codon:yes gene_type:complete